MVKRIFRKNFKKFTTFEGKKDLKFVKIFEHYEKSCL
jgi:hypothetical protein